MSDAEIPDSQVPFERGIPTHSPGEMLAQSREAQTLSRLQVSEKLGLTETAIRDIELCRFDKFPSGIYVRGYIRNYCRLLGMNADEVLASYDEYGKTHDTPEESPFGHSAHHYEGMQKKQKNILIIGACVLAVLLLFAIFLDM